MIAWDDAAEGKEQNARTPGQVWWLRLGKTRFRQKGLDVVARRDNGQDPCVELHKPFASHKNIT